MSSHGKNRFTTYKTPIIYGLAIALIFAFLKWLEWRYILTMHALEMYTGFIALIFTVLGVWFARRVSGPKTVVQLAPTVPDTPVTAGNGNHELSPREMEVLLLMAAGLSNHEIALRLFVSLNTVKTHTSNIFAKLNVNRRTQAVKTARDLKIIG